VRRDHAQNLRYYAALRSLEPGGGEDALRMAQKAVDLVENAATWQSMGIVLCRAGKWRRALEALEKSIDLQGDGGDAGQWFFVAMAKHKLGEKDAREWFERAVRWTAKHAPASENLKRNCAEAAALLGID